MATSSAAGDHYRGMFINFLPTALNAENAHYRAYGFQLRCLSE